MSGTGISSSSTVECSSRLDRFGRGIGRTLLSGDGEVDADVADPAGGPGVGAVGVVTAEECSGPAVQLGEDGLGLVVAADDPDLHDRDGSLVGHALLLSLWCNGWHAPQ